MLHKYYYNRCCSDTGVRNDVISKAEVSVFARHPALKATVDNNYTTREWDLLQYVQKSRIGCGVCIDGITAEYINWAKDIELIIVNYIRLTLCIRFGIVTDCFTQWLFIRLLDKPNIDPTIPKQYTPIDISTAFLKILEIDVIPELCWPILLFWYNKLIVYIRCRKNISEAVQICKGTS